MALTSASARHLDVEDEQLAAFCRRHHIARLGFLGALLHDDSEPNSDVDVLVEFEAGRSPGYISLAGMEMELTEALGREAHIYTVPGLSTSLGNATVLASAQWRYGAP